MHPNLSFEQAPPISVPLRFFLLAPCFGVLAGLVVAFAGINLGTRWTGESLALTHLLGAGFMLQAMGGALLQFVPVAAGGNVWRPRLVAAMVQPLLGVGVLLLAAGFWLARPPLLEAAAVLLLLGIVIFSVAITVALWRTSATGATLAALRFAVIGLLVAGSIGASLASGMARGWPLAFPALTDVHLGWALGAWALMLLMGVSYYVVPMFQLTPPYGAVTMRWLGPVLFGLVLAWSGASLISVAGPWRTFSAAGLLLVAAHFSLATLRVQSRRRRRVNDATLHLFRLAMVSLLLFVGIGLAMPYSEALQDDRVMVTMGLLALTGVFVSAITGMLYKIVPFIVWLHLQRLGAPLTAIPNMKNIISTTAMTVQMRLHVLAVGLLLWVPWLPRLSSLAGLAFAAASAGLGYNLLVATRRYALFRDRIRAAGADHGS